MRELIELQRILNTIGRDRRLRTAADKDLSSVVIRHPENPDYILHGLRKDNKKWTLPGGHQEGKELPHEGAARELKEETGLQIPAKDLQFLVSDLRKIKDDLYSIFIFEAQHPDDLWHQWDCSNDPDSEFICYKFLNPLTCPNEILHVPRERSLLAEYLLGTTKD